MSEISLGAAKRNIESGAIFEAKEAARRREQEAERAAREVNPSSDSPPPHCALIAHSSRLLSSYGSHHLPFPQQPHSPNLSRRAWSFKRLHQCARGQMADTSSTGNASEECGPLDEQVQRYAGEAQSAADEVQSLQQELAAAQAAADAERAAREAADREIAQLKVGIPPTAVYSASRIFEAQPGCDAAEWNRAISFAVPMREEIMLLVHHVDVC